MESLSKSKFKKIYLSSLINWFVVVVFFIGISFLCYKLSILYSDTLHGFQEDIGRKIFAQCEFIAYIAVFFFIGLAYMIHKRRLQPKADELPLMRHIGKWPEYSQLPSTVQFNKSQITPRIMLSFVILTGLFLYACSGDTKTLITFLIIYSVTMIAILPRMKNLKHLTLTMAPIDAFHLENETKIKRVGEVFKKDLEAALPVMIVVLVILLPSFSNLLQGNFLGILFWAAGLLFMGLIIFLGNYFEKEDSKKSSDNVLQEFMRIVFPPVIAFIRVMKSLKARHLGSEEDPIGMYLETISPQADNEIKKFSENQQKPTQKQNDTDTQLDASDGDTRYFDFSKLVSLLPVIVIVSFIMFPEVTENLVGKEIFDSIKSGIQYFLDFITNTLKIKRIPDFYESPEMRFNALFLIGVVIGLAFQLVEMILVIAKIIYDNNFQIHQKKIGKAILMHS